MGRGMPKVPKKPNSDVPIKVIFLDIDGVLVTRESIAKKQRLNGHCTFDKKAVTQLNRITDTTGAVIVMSSTWRTFFDTVSDIRKLLKQRGVTGKLIDRTEDLSNYTGVLYRTVARGEEIKHWLLNNKQLNVNGIVILDDDSDMLYMTPWLVKTNMSGGLTESKADEAIKMLLNGKVPELEIKLHG